MKAIRLALLGLMALAAQARAGDAPDAGTKLVHRGFTIDIKTLVDNKVPDQEEIKRLYRRQIDIVADLPLRPEVLEYFQKVPILTEAMNTANPGRCDGKRVFLEARMLAPDRVILLHELLHAYHHQVLAGGERNPTVIAAYQAALGIYPFNRNEDFLANEREFFAVTASIYLYGNILRPPYSRETIQEAQPAYFNYLASLFPTRTPASKAPTAKARRKAR